MYGRHSDRLIGTRLPTNSNQRRTGRSQRLCARFAHRVQRVAGSGGPVEVDVAHRGQKSERSCVGKPELAPCQQVERRMWPDGHRKSNWGECLDDRQTGVRRCVTHNDRPCGNKREGDACVHIPDDDDPADVDPTQDPFLRFYRGTCGRASPAGPLRCKRQRTFSCEFQRELNPGQGDDAPCSHFSDDVDGIREYYKGKCLPHTRLGLISCQRTADRSCDGRSENDECTSQTEGTSGEAPRVFKGVCRTEASSTASGHKILACRPSSTAAEREWQGRLKTLPDKKRALSPAVKKELGSIAE